MNLSFVYGDKVDNKEAQIEVIDDVEKLSDDITQLQENQAVQDNETDLNVKLQTTSTVDSNEYFLGDGSALSVEPENTNSENVKEQNTTEDTVKNTYDNIQIEKSTSVVTEKSSLISAGQDHILYVGADGEIYVKGSNEYGQLGTGDTISRDEYTDISYMFEWKKVIKVKTLYNTSYAITEDNQLYGWGDNSNNKVVNNSNLIQLEPVKILDNVADVQTSQFHTVALTINGDVYGWGNNKYNAMTDEYGQNISAPELIYSGVKSIAVSDRNTFIIDNNNILYGVGYNSYGELGVGDYLSHSSFVKIMSDVVDVACGTNHTVILDNANKMYVCGYNGQGQLANATNSFGSHISTPTEIRTATKIYAALNMTAYEYAGRLYQCGSCIYPANENFVYIHNIDNDSDITLNKDCYALSPSKVVKHWGLMTDNTSLLSSSGNTSAIPEKLKLNTNFKQADTYRYQSLAIDDENYVWAWGEGYYADGTDQMTTHYYPVKINGLNNIVQVERGKNHNLAVDDNGYVYGWGSNTNYVLGIGLGGKVKTVTQIDGINNVKMVSASEAFSIFLKNDGTIWGVGNNSEKQILNNDTSYYYTPTQLFDKDDFIAISSSSTETIALDKEGKIYSFGGGHDFTEVGANTGSKFVAVDAGDSHYLALTDKGYVYGWGDNSQGQLGKGDKETLTTLTLMRISHSFVLSNIKSVYAGYRQSFAISNDGKVYGCGSGTAHQLGLNNTGTTQYATQITNFNDKNISYISCGHDFTIALGDAVYVLGNSRYGTLGTYLTNASIDYIDLNVTADITGIYGYQDSISTSGQKKVYKFVPSKSGKYHITALGKTFISGRLFQYNMQQINSNSSKNNDVLLKMTNYLEEGKPCYIEVNRDGGSTGDFTLYVEEDLTVDIN